MASRRDQLHSYQFMVQRAVSAVVYRDTELAQVPFGRAGATLFISVMVAVLALGAVGIYGLFSPGGNKSWRAINAIIVEKETGARYVYVDERLHPVLNYSSARLILKQDPVATVLVASASLRDAPRGPALGIVGAPDSLPPGKRLITGGWVLCSQPESDEAGRLTTASVLFVGGRSGAGRSLGDDEGVLVRHRDGSVYLVWRSHRFQIRDPRIVLNALALGQVPPVTAAPAWINALPAGPDLERIVISKRGAASALRGSRVGQVVVARSQSGESQYYAVLSDGIADVTAVQADILLNDPETVAAYPGDQPRAIQRGDLATAKRSTQSLLPRSAAGRIAPPTKMPTMVSFAGDRAGMCASFGDVASPPQVSLDVPVLDPAEGNRPVQQTGEKATLADRVVVSPGGGAVVAAVMSAESPVGALSIVTDLGVRHPLASPEVLGYLGYGEGSIVRMPSSLVTLLPVGPALSPEAAGAPVAAG